MLSSTPRRLILPQLIRRLYSTHDELQGPQTVDTILARFDRVDIHEFRERAFIPEKPILMSSRTEKMSTESEILCDPPAAHKWFSTAQPTTGHPVLSQEYLSPFSDTILPYELTIEQDSLQEWLQAHASQDGSKETALMLAQTLRGSDGVSFHRFDAPLSLFLQASRFGPPTLKRLYIAQAQIVDLAKQLQDDLPTPRIVREAGKGDVYDANIWMGMPPTYTPLHKDPNPNLFIQLASSKHVKIFRPDIGSAIFREVQQKIGRNSSAALRGNEMMEGPERDALDHAIWDDTRDEGLEAVVNPGDALFIPKGWWHSIKSLGEGLTVSANWWFR